MNYVNRLESYHNQYIDLIRRMISVDSGNIYHVDMYAIAAIQRSINILDGFIKLIKDRNIIAAAPLLRLQIDTCLRFYAVFIVEKPHEFALKVLEGEHVRRMKDSKGKKMTDAYLVTELASNENILWLQDVYDHTSGYIHLSDKHILNTFRKGENNTLEGIIGLGDSHIMTHDIYIEAINTFEEATRLFMAHIEGWINSKESPR